MKATSCKETHESGSWARTLMMNVFRWASRIVVLGVLFGAPLGYVGCGSRKAQFFKSCYEGDLVTVKHVVASTGVNISSDSGRTGLMMASWAGHTNVIFFLLQAGSRASQSDDQGRLALDYALDSGHATAAYVLIEALLAEDGWDRHRVLVALAKRGYATHISMMLSHGVDPNAREPSGWTALMCAAWMGHTNACRVLLQGGADPNMQGEGKDRTWPIIVAAVAGNDSIVELLVGYGAKLSVRDSEGLGSLQRAVLLKKNNVVKKLLALGADPNVTYDDVPLLFLASKLQNWGVVESLLEAGAVPTMRMDGHAFDLISYIQLEGITNMPSSVKRKLEAASG